MKIVIVGSDATLVHVCRSLTAKNFEVVIVCADERYAHVIANELAVNVLVGSGADVDMLEAAGIEQAEALLAMAPDDATNLVACRLAKELFHVQRCFALVRDPDNEKAFLSVGADVTFSMAGFLSDRLTVGMTHSGVLRQMSFAHGQMVLVEVVLPQGAAAVGRQIAALAPTVQCVAALRGSAALSADDILCVGDYLALTVSSDRLGRILDIVLGRDR